MGKEKQIKELLGHTIKQLRLEKSLSQEKLAEKAGLDRSYISEIERGIKAATVITIVKLAQGLDIKPSSLFRKIEDRIDLN